MVAAMDTMVVLGLCLLWTTGQAAEERDIEDSIWKQEHLASEDEMEEQEVLAHLKLSRLEKQMRRDIVQTLKDAQAERNATIADTAPLVEEQQQTETDKRDKEQMHHEVQLANKAKSEAAQKILEVQFETEQMRYQVERSEELVNGRNKTFMDEDEERGRMEEKANEPRRQERKILSRLNRTRGETQSMKIMMAELRGAEDDFHSQVVKAQREAAEMQTEQERARNQTYHAQSELENMKIRCQREKRALMQPLLAPHVQLDTLEQQEASLRQELLAEQSTDLQSRSDVLEAKKQRKLLKGRIELLKRHFQDMQKDVDGRVKEYTTSTKRYMSQSGANVSTAESELLRASESKLLSLADQVAEVEKQETMLQVKNNELLEKVDIENGNMTVIRRAIEKMESNHDASKKRVQLLQQAGSSMHLDFTKQKQYLDSAQDDRARMQALYAKIQQEKNNANKLQPPSQPPVIPTVD